MNEFMKTQDARHKKQDWGIQNYEFIIRNVGEARSERRDFKNFELGMINKKISDFETRQRDNSTT
jgi:hypothetical protein